MGTRTIVIGLAVLMFVAGASVRAHSSDILAPCELATAIGDSPGVYVRVRGTARILGAAITLGDGCTLPNRVYVDVRPSGRLARGGNAVRILRRLQRDSGISYPAKGITVFTIGYKFATVDLEGWLHHNPEFDKSDRQLDDPSHVVPLSDKLIRSECPLVLDVTRVFGVFTLHDPRSATTPN